MSVEQDHRVVNLGELRIKLDRMTERIVALLKDRVLLPLNEAVYQPDGVPIENRPGISLFQFALEGLETYHASLGRYIYPDQFPILDLNLSQVRIKRIVNQELLPQADINIKDDLLSFYKDLLVKYCKPGDDPNTYGTTADLDARVVELIHERVNIGRPVSDVKAKKDPTIYESMDNDDFLLSKFKDKNREEALIARARELAQANRLDPELAEEAFRWMIDKTLFIEIAYIQKVGKPGNGHQ